jgi:putative ABC transport system permease protein
MHRLAFKNLVANKLRFALTTFGVILAVSFVVSAFVLGDGLRSTFTDVSEDITAGVDLEVRNVAEFGDDPALPADTVSVVAGVDGVADAVASIEAAENAVRPIKANGDTIATDGPPQLAFNWIDNPALSAFTLVDGAPPAIGEFTMDVDAVENHDFVIGDTYELMVPDGRVDLRLSGTTSFGADNATLGAVLMQMNTDQASELFGVDGIGSVAVQVADGADATQVQADVQAAVVAAVPTAEVVDHATVLEETTTEFTDEIDMVGNILLGFGGVALFVSIFIIYNTFAIVLGQRTRELALLRTLGADAKQIRRSVLGEAFVVGVLASAGGIGGGIAVAKGIEALFLAIGVDLSDYPLILAPRTLIAAAVIGIGVTMIAAIGPARRAATVPPIAALTDRADSRGRVSKTRVTAGFGLLATGLIAGAAGLAGIGPTSATVAGLAFGAIAIFLGVTALSPVAVSGVTRVVGWPMRKVAGVAGRLAQQNAARNSRRTATTAAALMIGLALVSTALVVGESVKASLGSTLEQSALAEYYLTDELDDVEFPATLADTGVPNTPEWLAVSIADGASPAAVAALVADLSDRYPHASIETADQFRERVAGMVDDVLIMVNAMVALAVIIALIGIANTLALSVFERTRELGLIRAVGMSRRQLRRMVRLEAALVATFGATLGVGLGLLFGFGIVQALPASFASQLAVPIVPIVVVVLVAALAAVAAAWLPARRASRLDVLKAIAI